MLEHRYDHNYNNGMHTYQVDITGIRHYQEWDIRKIRSAMAYQQYDMWNGTLAMGHQQMHISNIIYRMGHQQYDI